MLLASVGAERFEKLKIGEGERVARMVSRHEHCGVRHGSIR